MAKQFLSKWENSFNYIRALFLISIFLIFCGFITQAIEDPKPINEDLNCCIHDPSCSCLEYYFYQKSLDKIPDSPIKPAKEEQAGFDQNQEKTHFRISRVSAGGPVSEKGKKILEAAYLELGYTVEFVMLQAEESLQQSNAGAIDAELFRVFGIEESYPNLVPVPVPFIVIENRLFAREDWTKEITEWDDLIPIVKDKNDLAIRKGLLKGEQQADSRSIPYTRFETLEKALEMLSEGKINLVYEASVTTNISLDKLGIENVKALEPPLDSVALYHYVHKDNSFLVPKLEKIFTKLFAEDLLVKEKITPSQEEMNWLAENHTVRARLIQWPPYMFTSPKIQGVSIDYLNFFAKEYGINIEYVLSEIPFSEAIKDLETERNYYDLQLTLKRTPERLEKLAMSQHYISAPWVIISTKDRTDIKTIEDLEGKAIAVEKGYAISDLLKENYPKIQLKHYTTSQESLDSVATGEVDAYIGNLAMAIYYMNKGGLINLQVKGKTPFGNHDQAMATHKDWAPLTTLFDKWLNTLSPDEHFKILNKWVINYEGISSGLKKIELTDVEKSWLAKHPEINLGFNPDMEPLVIVGENGNLSGIVVDIYDEIESLTGLKVNISIDEWSATIQKARDEKLDGLLVSSEVLAKDIDLLHTKIFVEGVPTIFARKDANLQIKSEKDLLGKKVAVLKGIFVIEELLEPYKYGIEIVETEDALEMLTLVLEGEVDAAMGLSFHNYLVAKHFLVGIEPVYFSPLVGSSGVASINPEWPEFVSIMNKALEHMGEERLNEIIQNWINVKVEEKIDWVLIYKIAGTIILISIFIIFGVIFVMRKFQKELKKEVKEKTKEIVKINKDLFNEIEDRKIASEKLVKKTNQLQRFIAVLKGRERRIMELKKRSRK